MKLKATVKFNQPSTPSTPSVPAKQTVQPLIDNYMIVDVVLRSPTEPVVTKTEPIPEAKKSYVAGETEKM